MNEDKTYSALRAVDQEVRLAMNKHHRFNSAHEGLAVILEEFEELKAEVWKKRSERSHQLMYDEAKQVAAMAIRFMVEVCNV